VRNQFVFSFNQRTLVSFFQVPVKACDECIQ
jgi:hypothetical protein